MSELHHLVQWGVSVPVWALCPLCLGLALWRRDAWLALAGLAFLLFQVEGTGVPIALRQLAPAMLLLGLVARAR